MTLEPVASGIHLSMHWFVQRLPDQRLLITFSGYVEGHLAYRQEERASATPADVKALIEEEVAAVQARQAKQRGSKHQETVAA